MSSLLLYSLHRTILSASDSGAVSQSLVVLYLASTGQFWFGLTFRAPMHYGMGVVYLAINIALVLSSSISFLLALWGGTGILIYHISVLFRYDTEGRNA